MKNVCLIFSSSLLSLCLTAFAQDSSIPASSSFSDDGATPDALMERAAVIKHAATKTTLSVAAGTLGQPTLFNATVRALAAAGSPTGTIYLVDRGTVFAQFTISPTNSPDPKYAYSAGSYTLTNEAGSAALIGKHTVKAMFFGTSIYSKSTGSAKFIINQPAYTGLTNGVQIATVQAGIGPGATNGQTVGVFYTGYLAKTGKIFDDSAKHPDPTTQEWQPLTWILGGPRVISGFNEGIFGMQTNETRLIVIPPDAAYGKAGVPQAGIPPNATLIFLVKLVP